MSQSKRWTFTLNNWTSEEYQLLVDLGESLQAVQYLIVGKETGTEGTPHLQGYVEFSSRKRITGVKRLLGNRCHLERARGSAAQNKTYCSKDGDFVEWGAAVVQGQRTDLEQIRDMIRDGATNREIADAHFGSWVRYRNSFSAYRTLVNEVPTTTEYLIESFPTAWQSIAETWDRTKTLILWGPPNIGKTHFALCLLKKALMLSHLDRLSILDTSIHEGVIFDDMDFRHFPVSSQIHLVDTAFDRDIHIRYQTALLPSGVPRIVTTNVTNGEVFDLSPEFGVKRRCEIHHLDNFE